MHDFVQTPVVADVKLRRIILRRLFFGIAAYTGFGTAANLGNAKVQYTLPAGLGFSRRYNHPGIGNRNSKTCHNFGKDIVADSVVKYIRINVIRLSDTGYADGMRSYAPISLHMLCVHNNSGKIIAIIVQSEQYANSHIINTGLSCSIHSLCMISVIALWSCRVQILIRLLVVGFLEQNICADSGIFQFPVIFYCSRRNIHIDPADCPIFVFDAVNRPDTLQNIFNGIIYRVFSGL